jgi:peptide/nickel transport system permease protein
MLRYLFQRLLAIVAILFGVTVVTFFIAQVVPADPAVNQAGEFATNAQVEQVRKEQGLDRPLPVQYGIYVKRLVQGDFGTSLFTQQSVATELTNRSGATFDLATAAMILALLIGVPAGVAGAVYRDSLVDHAARILALLGTAMPIFWLALLMVRLFYSGLHWLPANGRYSLDLPVPPTVTHSLVVDSVIAGDWAMLGSALQHLVLPALALGIMGAGLISRVMRASMLDVLGRDFIVTARVKGLSRRRVIYVHALRNALLPAVTVIGVTYGALLGGTVLTEKIFSWPGLGLYAVESIEHLDFPAVMGVVVIITIAYVAVNLVVDLGYGWLDPRVRRVNA